jgi:hypothetical protein
MIRPRVQILHAASSINRIEAVVFSVNDQPG